MRALSSPVRYGSVAIAIHWIVAATIVLLFATGLAAAGQADPAAKIALLRAHIPLGVGVLLLTLLRLAWWMVADRNRPASPVGQSAWQKATARTVHLLLYVVVVATAASGIATIVLSGALPAIVGSGALPDLTTVLPRSAHGALTRLLLALLALHIGAALYHQFIRRDRIMARMGIGQ
jgi:cytochrome b561